jgi:hypothetical protein
VEAATRTIDPDALWWPPSRLDCAKPREQRAAIVLQELREEEVLGDHVITTDDHRPKARSAAGVVHLR